MYLQLNNLSKKFKNDKVVNNLSIGVDKGEVLCLLGPSGCGKTTTLKMIGGFLKADEGSIFIDGMDITKLSPEDRPVSTVFQSYALFPHLTVLENVIYGLKFQKYSKGDATDKGMEYLDTVGLSDYANSKIHELSGGQQQRVALARSLIVNPKVLLLDEPLSNLDAKLRVKMREEIKYIQKKFNMTMVFVTHDQEEALVIGDKIAIMNGGNLIQVGTPEEVYNKPDSLFAMNFLGVANKFIEDDGEESYIRPENIRIDDDGDFEGEIVTRTFLGFYNEYSIKCNNQYLTIRAPGYEEIHKKGEIVKLKFYKSMHFKEQDDI